MINPENEIKQGIVTAFQALYEHTLLVEDIQIQPTKKEFEGSHTFVVFPYLRVSRKKPEDTATEIGAYLQEQLGAVGSFNVVKGFLNLSLASDVWVKTLEAIAAERDFGQIPRHAKKVMVEFSSPNTNKPLHLGHLRNNFLGDSVSRIMDMAGYEVMKVNLVNDRGIHICKSMLAYEKYGNGETPDSAGIKGDHLIGKYYVRFDQEYKKEITELIAGGASEEEAKKNAPLLLEAQELLKKWESNDQAAVSLWQKMNEWVYEGFDETYQTMGISFDKIYKESETYLLGKDIVSEGLAKEVFFKKDDDSVWVDLTDAGLDEKLVLRADGTAVYITQDMGTCDFKHKDFPFDQSVYVVGNEQDYHFNVLFKIMAKLGRPYADGLCHLSYGMVDLPTGKMKSREGTVVDADDLMQRMFDTAEQQTRELGKIEGLTDDEAARLYKMLGLGALKYFLLKVDPKRRMLFNPEESIDFHGNTGPFIQYTHARISAISRRAKELGVNSSFDPKAISLRPKEQDVIGALVQFPVIVQHAARDYAPSVVAQYAYDLAKAYNSFYQDLKIFDDADDDQTAFRVILSALTAKTIQKAMGLLGVEVPQRM